MATERCCEYSVTSDLHTLALLKEEFVQEHLGKTYHRVGCRCLGFCLQHDSLSPKDRSKERCFAFSLMPQQQGFNLLTQGEQCSPSFCPDAE